MHSPREFVSSTGTPRYWPNYSWLVGSFPQIFRHTTDSSQDCGAKRPTKGSCSQCRSIQFDQFEWRMTSNGSFLCVSFHASVKYWANQPTSQFNNMRYLVFVLHSSGWADMPASPWTGRISPRTFSHFWLVRWCRGISTSKTYNQKSCCAWWFRMNKKGGLIMIIKYYHSAQQRRMEASWMVLLPVFLGAMSQEPSKTGPGGTRENVPPTSPQRLQTTHLSRKSKYPKGKTHSKTCSSLLCNMTSCDAGGLEMACFHRQLVPWMMGLSGAGHGTPKEFFNM